MSELKRTLDFKNINDYNIQINRWFLILMGGWPQTKSSSKIKKFAVSLQIFIFTSMMVIVTVPCILYVGLEEEDIKIKLNVLVPLLHRLMGCVNYWIILTRTKDIQICIKHMEMNWKIARKSDHEVMLQYARIGRFIAGFFAMFMYTGTFGFIAARVMKTTTFVIGNETFKAHPMTCPPYSKIVDVRFSPVNQIMFSIQIISAFVVASSVITMCSLAAVFAMHACGQLNVLCTWLIELAEEKKHHLAEKKLADIVEHHWRVLSFIAKIESIMHKALLGELLGCTLNMCLLGFYFVMNLASFNKMKLSSYVFGYITMSLNLFIFCYIGEVLSEQCRNIGEIAYMSNWYKLHHKTAQGLILIIMQSSCVVKITAGKLFRLSLATFGDIIKTSTAYLNLLRTVIS